jgi:hypothetical protein
LYTNTKGPDAARFGVARLLIFDKFGGNPMKNTTVQITYPSEKLEAIRQYIGKKDIDMSVELQEALSRLYEKHVPREVREFLEARESAPPEKPSRPRRPDRPLAPQAPAPTAPLSSAEFRKDTDL